MNMLNGYLVLNKPCEMTSAQAIGKLKKYLPKYSKIGHTGTLDPNVTGVLPIAIGSATKTISYLNRIADSNKKYRASMEFGFITDTLDIWGEVVESVDIPAITKERIEEVLFSMVGKQSQIPPMYSALKKNGVRLYDLARKGIVIEREAREIEILSFEVTCSKGTYVRSLCSDIATKLGTLGTMTALQRLKSDCFTMDMAIDLEQINEEVLRKNCIPIEKVFEEFFKINLSHKYALHVLNGVKVNLGRFLNPEIQEGEENNALPFEENEYFQVLYHGMCIAFAQAYKGEIYAKIRLCAVADLVF